VDILAIEHWGPLSIEDKVHNVVRLDISRPVPNLGRMERHFFTSSSCGVCGKASLASVRMPKTSVSGEPIAAGLIRQLPQSLREHQQAFSQTGGLHATAIFDSSGSLRYVFEDVGRHNALDKAAGALLFDNGMRATDTIVLVSGRVGFELVQKTIRMGSPVLCAIGAPSSLAVELARAASLTLVAFLRDDRFNVYSGADRLR
jgi:FdhD protein